MDCAVNFVYFVFFFVLIFFYLCGVLGSFWIFMFWFIWCFKIFVHNIGLGNAEKEEGNRQHAR